MESTTQSLADKSYPLRILVVDDELNVRNDTVDLIQLWQWTPVIAQGSGEDLLKDAVERVKEQRCQVAVVDMRLLDNQDSRDWSGLELVPQLKPAKVIILSGRGDRKSVREALRRYEAFDFVGKQDDPEELRAAILEAAKSICATYNRAKIGWPRGLTSAIVVGQLRKDGLSYPNEDEADELIACLFPKATQLRLTLVNGPARISDKDAALRRRSVILKAVRDNDREQYAIKISRVDKIEREVTNYHAYVEGKLEGRFRPSLTGPIMMWDIGAVAYSFFGNDDMNVPNVPWTFAALYRDTNQQIKDIMAPLEHFFEPRHWGHWFNVNVEPLKESLFTAYDEAWNNELSKELEVWSRHDQKRNFPGLLPALPNPTRWLYDHYADSSLVQARKAITHGDFHGDNLFVSRGLAWPIDFERTGPGPILRDFVELVHDILTRLSRIEPKDTLVLYELAVALCQPQAPEVKMRSTTAIHKHTAARRAFEVIQGIQELAYSRAHYEDRQEYLWGLLLNSIFMATILKEQNELDPRYTRTLLVASVICGRLDSWYSNNWPPSDWPQVDWLPDSELTV